MTSSAQAPASPPSAPIASTLPGVASTHSFPVTAAEFKAGDMVPLANTGYGQSLSPTLAWSQAPPATKSFVILLEDADTNFHGIPVTHWLAYNLPGTAAGLPGALPPQGKTPEPAGLVEGKNVRGTLGYVGPRPGHTPHHYHFQIMALDTVLPLEAGADRNAVVAAATGHVLAIGDLVALSVAPEGAVVGPPPAVK